MPEHHHSERKITIRSVRRNPPDMTKLGRALIALAMAQAEAEAEAESKARAESNVDASAADEPGSTPEKDAA